MDRRGVALLLAAALLPLPGCCWAARLACGIAPPASPARGTRDTPEAALRFLIDAFRERRVGDIYRSLHHDYRSENGGFSGAEFAAAYERFEADFAADAESLAAARLLETKYDAGRTLASLHLRNDANGAEVVIVFADEPHIRLVTRDEFIAPIEGPVDKAALVRLSGGRLGLASDFDLTTIENVEPETVSGLTSDDVVRVEIHDDWLVRSVPFATNIRFLDRIKEHVRE